MRRKLLNRWIKRWINGWINGLTRAAIGGLNGPKPCDCSHRGAACSPHPEFSFLFTLDTNKQTIENSVAHHFRCFLFPCGASAPDSSPGRWRPRGAADIWRPFQPTCGPSGVQLTPPVVFQPCSASCSSFRETSGCFSRPSSFHGSVLVPFCRPTETFCGLVKKPNFEHFGSNKTRSNR